MVFALYYIEWHYSRALYDIVGIIKNFIWFFYEFFSIPLLLKTYFSPFHRLGEQYAHSIDLGKWAETFIVNSLMRVVGVFLRTFIILCGVCCIGITISTGLILLFSWMVAPLCVVFLILYGFKMLSLG